MKLYRWYYPKNVNPYWIVTYNIPMNHPISTYYTVSLSNCNKLVGSSGTFHLFPELYVQVPIGVSNETI